MVEDDEMLSEIYQKKFGGGNYELFIAKNGREAIEKIKKHRPDLVLLDLVMPEMDGLEALTLIKKDPEIKDTKVIIASNLSQENEKQRALELGAADFLVKSNLDLGELAQKIEESIH